MGFLLERNDFELEKYHLNIDLIRFSDPSI